MFLATSDGAITVTPPTASDTILCVLVRQPLLQTWQYKLNHLFYLARIFTAAKIKRMNSYWLLTVSC